jgi:hypothetical protein
MHLVDPHECGEEVVLAEPETVVREIPIPPVPEPVVKAQTVFDKIFETDHREEVKKEGPPEQEHSSMLPGDTRNTVLNQAKGNPTSGVVDRSIVEPDDSEMDG